MLQVRVPKYKRLALSQPALNAFVEVDESNAFTQVPAARIGFHNDGFLAGPTDGGTWTESPHFGQPGNPEFDYMTRESAFVPVDGELFWSDQGFDGKAARGKGVNGLNAALRMRLHHYSSFSLAHSYSEREGKPYSIDHWLSTAITGSLRQAAMPMADGWFEDGFGKRASRTQFEYIQDYLGYRLELQSARIPEKVTTGAEFQVDSELVNRGFSTLCNPRPVSLVLMDRWSRGAGVMATSSCRPGIASRAWRVWTRRTKLSPKLHKGGLSCTLPPGKAPIAQRPRLSFSI